MSQSFGFHSERERLQSLERRHKALELTRRGCWWAAGASTIVTLYWAEAIREIPFAGYATATISGVAGAATGVFEWITGRENESCNRLVGQLACSEAITMEHHPDNRDLVEMCDRVASELGFVRQPATEDLE